jgi:hypothetical protein
MGIIHIDELEVGLKLAEDVQSPQGMKIASQGDTITAKHVKAFKAWGITEINIQGVDSQESRPQDEEPKGAVPRQVVVQEIDRLFEKTNRNDPVVSELYNLALNKAISG